MDDSEEMLIDSSDIHLQANNENNNDSVLRPAFPPVSVQSTTAASGRRKVLIPPHRRTPLRTAWMDIYTPLVEHLKLQVRYNTKSNAVEMRTSSLTDDPGALQKGEDFVKAFALGFAVEDAVALLRLDDLYIDSFEVDDVKLIHGDNMSRAIGRVAGKDGRVKFAIENATRTRIVVADKRIHVLGTFQSIKVARGAMCDLIIGSPINKVAAKLQSQAARLHTF